MNEKTTSSYFKTILLLSVAVWLVVMNTTMFNVALPNVLTEFNLSPADGAWIVSGYSIILAIFTITYTRLSDYLPIRRLLIAGIVIFGLGSVLGFFSETFPLLLAARLLQATGAAAIPGLSMVFAGRFIPFSSRGRAMAMIASASSLGFGLGPVVGGVVTEYLDWNYLFTVTLFVVLLIPILFRRLPEEEVRKGSFDIIGGLLTGATVTSFLLYISTFNWLFLALGIIIGGLLWLRITRTDIPFIQPSLFKNKGYRKLLYMSYLGFTTHFAILLLMPLMLQNVYEKGPSVVGYIIFPGAMLSAVAAIYVGRLLDRYGNMKVIYLAHGLLLISTVIFYFLSPLNEYMIMIGYMFTSFGFSSLSSSTTNEVSRILPSEEIATGIGMKQLIQFVGSASGSVAGGIMLELNGLTYSTQSFQLTYIFLLILMALSAIIMWVYARKLKTSV
ncbi:MFS transporter [Anaerobacillus sp. 1_MG-2023]|uniref:MFS transporter n=1 Tax=Bacillales TaxID=1385 RepID=UPI0026E42B0D|nr:MFS transporter [Anaerobacillus sp. 1_MG-2023]MDO6656474.1 MFS transporter [Anaerobacillus sp. 1_MG-2023]